MTSIVEWTWRKHNCRSNKLPHYSTKGKPTFSSIFVIVFIGQIKGYDDGPQGYILSISSKTTFCLFNEQEVFFIVRCTMFSMGLDLPAGSSLKLLRWFVCRPRRFACVCCFWPPLLLDRWQSFLARKHTTRFLRFTNSLTTYWQGPVFSTCLPRMLYPSENWHK